MILDIAYRYGTPEVSDSNTGETAAERRKRGHTRGGVAIILSPWATCTAAWEKAGQPELTRSGVISGYTRFIAISLHFTDQHRQHLSPYWSKPAERSKLLNNLNELYNSLDREDKILVTGCDINASIGNRESVYCYLGSTEETQDLNVIGPHGINYRNEAGVDLIQVLKAKNLSAPTTFIKHKKYATWKTNQRSNAERISDGDAPNSFSERVKYQLDQFFIQGKHLSRVLDVRRVGDEAPSNHVAIQLKLKLTTRMTRKKTRFNMRNRGEKRKRKSNSTGQDYRINRPR
eukprot:scaffold87167_cov56-Attheya_sp.AAC.1